MKEVNILLTHILESIQAIEAYTQDTTKQQFIKGMQLQDSIMRRLEIIGEAVRNLPMSFRKNHLYIPWEKIAGMRDVLIHQYFGIDLDLVWDTVKKNLPDLKREINEILELS